MVIIDSTDSTLAPTSFDTANINTDSTRIRTTFNTRYKPPRLRAWAIHTK